MNDHSTPLDDDEILDAFADLLEEVVPEEPDEVASLLAEVGLDPDQINDEVNALIQEARASTPLDWRNRQEEMEEALARHDQAGTHLPSDRASLLEVWWRLMEQPRARTLAAQYRNQKAEDMTDEELRSLIQDVRFILEVAEKNDDKQEE